VRAPAAGATLAFDPPAGERVEQVTDAEGRASFDGVDWSAGGPAALTAHVEGWTMGSRSALTEEIVGAEIDAEGAVVLTLYMFNSPLELVEVSGRATLVRSTDVLHVSPTTPGPLTTHSGASTRSRPAIDTPFSLVAFEWIGTNWVGRRLDMEGMTWSVFESAGLTEPTEIDIDLTVPVEATTFAGSTSAPVDTIGTFFEDAQLYVNVSSFESELNLMSGVHTHVDGETVPGEWSWEGEYVALDDVASPATSYNIGTRSQSSWVIVPGLPEEGEVDLAFASRRS